MTKKAYFAIAVLSLSAILYSCGGGHSAAGEGYTTVTGWEVNSAEWGGFHSNLDKPEMDLPVGMVFVEGGTFIKGSLTDNVMYEYDAVPTRQHVSSFYMDETEVTNISYREYLFWLRKVFPPSEDRFRYIYSSQVPDTLVWRRPLSNNETLVTYYLRHPAYNFYPVVGVNWMQAKKFCEWRTDRVNEATLIELGIMNQVNSGENEEKIVYGENHFNLETYTTNPSLVFSEQSEAAYGEGLPAYEGESEEGEGSFVGRHADISDGVLTPPYRLPSETEWEYAAYGLAGNRYLNSNYGQRAFPWEGKNARPDQEEVKDSFLANFKRREGDYGGIAGWPNDGASYTSEVKSFPPNDIGLFDMAGNVAEWVNDVYRPVSGEPTGDDLNYVRGNVFTKKKYNPDGTIAYVSDEVPYDTLITGKVIAKNLPGSFEDTQLDPEDTYMRSNYQRGDNINYGDGDLQSSREFRTDPNSVTEIKNQMYNSPINKVSVDENGKVTGEYDKNSKRYTLISDDVRVFKGGSWKDRVFWLGSGQRRFLHQDRAESYIGFRCAMNHLGKESPGRTETASSF